MIIDTDIGYDPDDLFALLLALQSPEVEISLIITADEISAKRAVFAKQILELAGRSEIPVVPGIDLGNYGNFVVDELLKISSIADESHVQAIKRVMDSAEDGVIFLGIGGFTNLSRFLKAYPDYAQRMDICMMGGAINYSRGEDWIEHNVRIDKEAAQHVLRTKTGKITLVGTQTTFHPEYEVNTEHAIFKRLKSSGNPVHTLLARHMELFKEKKNAWPKMHDPLTLATAIGKDFFTLHTSVLSIDEDGKMSSGGDGEKIYWSDPVSKSKEFMEFLEIRLFT